MKQVKFIPAFNIQANDDMKNYRPCHKHMFNQVADFVAMQQIKFNSWKRYTQCIAELFSCSVNSYKVSLYQV